jgi:hypothetical protein
LAATRFYRQTLDRQIRTLSRDRRWTVWLFVTPDHVLDHPAWHRANVRGQGQGDLGQRMKRPFRLLPPGPVVLVRQRHSGDAATPQSRGPSPYWDDTSWCSARQLTAASG